MLHLGTLKSEAPWGSVFVYKDSNPPSDREENRPLPIIAHLKLLTW